MVDHHSRYDVDSDPRAEELRARFNAIIDETPEGPDREALVKAAFCERVKAAVRAQLANDDGYIDVLLRYAASGVYNELRRTPTEQTETAWWSKYKDPLIHQLRAEIKAIRDDTPGPEGPERRERVRTAFQKLEAQRHGRSFGANMDEYVFADAYDDIVATEPA